ncbi:sugar ABC transporter ATP-binding protein [Acidocella sp. C78]|uniref:sugar ABC transporter ATP-binding protein n=1 Tax=Acidocella sp. C78 TaxID=1671486 RepID=UPI00191B9F62|nr:sugar ABC transporter ATP-binding protein [Acidocella sp. C78]
MALLELHDIWKRFGVTQALSGAAFDLRAGEIHALVGANGAGKSTLSRIISGHIRPDSGEILLNGARLRHAGARDAIRAGITMVTQETSLAPDLSVLENIMLPRIAMPGRLDWRALRAQARALIGEIGQSDVLRPDMKVSELSIGQRQLVEILKALALDSRIIIFDEPTAALSPHEAEQLFGLMRSLATRGHGLIFVSHRLEEIFAVTDRVTVLREGRIVASGLATETMQQGELVRLMVGRELQDIYDRGGRSRRRTDGAVVLRVSHLSCPPMVRDVSFEVRAGEVLGLAGLVGAGRSETIETIFGLRQPVSGTIELDGKPFRARSPRDAIRAGIGLVPEDRRGQAIVPDFSVRENLLLAHLGARSAMTLGYGTRGAAVRALLERLDLPERRLLDANMLNFSGGMQQKVILARGLVLAPRLLLLDEPTRGVDIGTRSSIYAMLRRIADEGVACVVVSSDFEEVIGVSDRIAVLSDGVSVAELPAELIDIEKLGMFAAPRSSAEKTHTMLGQLVARYGGTAYWMAAEGGRLFCFDRVGDDPSADPGFVTGGFPEIAATSIAHAVGAPRGALHRAPDGSRPTLLVPISGKRGHSLGIVGLTFGREPADFDAPAVTQQILAALGERRDAQNETRIEA